MWLVAYPHFGLKPHLSDVSFKRSQSARDMQLIKGLVTRGGFEPTVAAVKGQCLNLLTNEPFGATDETRTHTIFLSTELKSDASANFATVADCYDTTLKMLTKPNLKQRLVLP